MFSIIGSDRSVDCTEAISFKDIFTPVTTLTTLVSTFYALGGENEANKVIFAEVFSTMTVQLGVSTPNIAIEPHNEAAG